MRKLLVLLLALACAPAWAATWYVGPTSAGAANGTSEANRWGVSSVGWSSMASGDTLLFSVGTYSGAAARFNINSTSANYSSIRKLVIEGNNQTLDCQYAATHCLYLKAAAGIKIQNLTVKGATTDGIRFDGSDGTIGLHDVTLYNVTSRESKVCGFAVDNGAYNVTFDHVVGALNYDSSTPGNSDGFCTHNSTSGSAGANVVIQDSQFYNNSDDGIDLFQSNNAVTVRRVHSYNNGYFANGTLAGGDGRGIVLGPGVGAHVVSGSIFDGNAQFGIHRRDNSAVVTLANNTVVHNGAGIAGGKNINFPDTVDLNFPTSQTRFTDSGVNSEYRAISQPVSSLSVGAQAYTLGTVGALGVNQYGYSAPYVYVKGNPGTATVNTVPTTQSSASNNASFGGANADTRTGLTSGATNTWNTGASSGGFVAGTTPTTAAGFCLGDTSPLRGAGTYIGAYILDYYGHDLGNPPHIGAMGPCRGRVPAATRPSAATRVTH